MSTIEKSIEVEAPLRTVYDQWTQFETFPRFMDGVEQVKQLDDKHLHWRAKIAGVTREWDAEIVDQTPDQQIAWRATDGTTNNGAVLFRPVDEAHTKVTMRLDFEPEGIVEKAGDALNFVDMKAEGDLERFKEYVETGKAPTGAWRGEVKPSGEVNPDQGEAF